MLTIEPTGAILGATVRGLDAAAPLSRGDFGQVLAALGQYGVLRFPDQQLDEDGVRRFSQLFGDIQGPSRGPLGSDGKEVPVVGILSNLKENGQYIGAADAGQDWHTDMSYRDVIGFVNVLYGIRIPRRDGKPLGGTEFSNMHAAYEALPETIRTRLANATVTHAFEKFWEHMRQHKNERPPADDRGAAPPPSAGRASIVPDASDHRPEGAVLQSRLLDPHQRTTGDRKRRDASVSVRPSAGAAVPLHAPLDGERFAGVGSHRNDPSGDRRLSA